ncbi:MAG TPA: AraC family transcriptional regulator [Opitutaceae bacterium]|nr:AraC family transcriptional regulator [Opitutaceae bacterium]
MLRYLGAGPRQFGLFPLKPSTRLNWEFFAVLKGPCAPLIPGAPAPELVRRTLWVSPPGSPHSWAGEGARRAEVAVLHFGSVPAPLEAIVRERGQLALALKAEECRRLAALVRQLQPDFRQPDHCSNLVFQAALIELTLLVLRKLPPADPSLLKDYTERVVENATNWFAEHVRTNPTIDEVARVVHVSPSTLRRFFRRVLRERPTRVFGRMQIEQGMRLMTGTKLKLDTIAQECGFTCTSDFCRAFKSVTKVTPTEWRRNILKAPRAANVA